MQTDSPSFSLALLTGASSGIGESLARLLADKGISLVLSGRNKERLEALAQELRLRVEVDVVPADLASAQELEALSAQIRARAPDLTIHNAGFGLYGDAASYAVGEQMDILRVNGAAALTLTLEAVQALLARSKKGTILNVSSAAAFQPFPGFAVYAASKKFINHFSEALDWELRAEGIRVLTACPGVVLTEFRRRAGGKRETSDWKGMTPDFAAAEIWRQIEKGNALRVFDVRYRLALFAAKFLPKRWLMRYLHKEIKKIIPLKNS